MKKTPITHFKPFDPTYEHDIDAGFSIGQKWFNIVKSREFIHIEDGVWFEYSSYKGDDFLQSKWFVMNFLQFSQSSQWYQYGFSDGGILESYQNGNTWVKNNLNRYNSSGVVFRGSPSSSGSGYVMQGKYQEQLFEGTTMFFIIRPLILTTTTRIGFCDNSVFYPGDTLLNGACLEINGTQLTLVCANNGLQTVSPGYTIPNVTDWLYIMIEVEKNSPGSGKQIRIKVKNTFEDTSYLLNSVITTNITDTTEFPSGTNKELSMNKAAVTGSYGNYDFLQIAYAAWGAKKPTFLNNF